MYSLFMNLPSLPRFWDQAYSRYRRPLARGLGFHVPEFPHPLVSPNFALGDRAAFIRENQGSLSHFNEIVPLGHDQRGPAPDGFRLETQFFLGEKQVTRRDLPAGFTAKVIPLSEAVKGEQLWDLIEDGFPRDAPFLRKLLPFLATLDADFHTAFLHNRGRTVGAVSIGAAAGASLVLNAVVPSAERGRGFSSLLTDAAQSLSIASGAQTALFWTEHAFFGRHADLVRHYRVFRAWPPAC
jgi:hypothetical protein